MKRMLINYLAVGGAGFVGAAARYAVTTAFRDGKITMEEVWGLVYRGGNT